MNANEVGHAHIAEQHIVRSGKCVTSQSQMK